MAQLWLTLSFSLQESWQRVSVDDMNGTLFLIVYFMCIVLSQLLANLSYYLHCKDTNKFRPPWFHRNVMTKFMVLIYGDCDAKKNKGGAIGASLHPIMTPHRPDTTSYFPNVKNPCDKQTKLDGGLAFMFESSAMCRVSRYALECEQREVDYASCCDGLVGTFPKPQVQCLVDCFVSHRLCPIPV